MKFNLLILIYLFTSCTTNYTKIDNRKPYNAKGFAYIFNQADRDKNIIKGRMNNDLLEISHSQLKYGATIKLINPKTKEKKRTNTFEFCFGVKGSSDSSPGTASESKIEIPEIIPRTYEEGMAYLTARRNLNSMRANSAEEDQRDETVLFDLKHYLRA